jgi:hypothetical protein
MATMQFTDKFVAFVDILGFKQLVAAAESGTGMSLGELLEAAKKLGSAADREVFATHGPTICPASRYIRRDLGFQLIQISDCVIVSSEVSPAGVINLVNHCWKALIRLLQSGLMCRGYITRGSVFHTDSQIIGTGYQKAYEAEGHVTAFKRQADELGTPFVEVDPSVCDYVANSGDACVKEMFSRHVKDDGAVVAVFPFQRLSHSFIVAGVGSTFDPARERQSNDNMRRSLQTLKERVATFVDRSNPKAVSKAEHYQQALDAQLRVCDRVDEAIRQLSSPYPSGQG